MRILLVGDASSPHLERWAAALGQAGEDVACASFTPPEVLIPNSLGVESLGRAALSDRRYAVAIPVLARIARRVQPDIVHAHYVASYGVMSAMAIRHTPTLQFAWGSDILWRDRQPRAQRALVSLALRRAAAVVYDDEAVGAAVAALAPTVPRVRALFGPERAWTELPRREERCVLSPRQLKGFYNVDAILRAAAPVLIERDWSLDVLTGGSDASVLQDLARSEGVADRVRFHPRLDRIALRDLFLAAAIFCSVPDSDATSAAMLEGMGAGSFPIVSDLPAAREWVRDCENGFLVPAGDVGALRDAIVRAIDDPALRARAAVANRQRIAESATWEAAVDSVRAASARALERRG